MKEKILRIRPFNMANFSSGAGMWAFLAIFVLPVFLFPAMLIVWVGFALPLETEDGTINYEILVRRLNRVLLPICATVFILPLAVYILPLIPHSLTLNAFMGMFSLAILISIPIFGIFFASRLAAAGLHKSGRLSKGRYLGRVMGATVLLHIVIILAWWVIFMLYDALGGTEMYASVAIIIIVAALVFFLKWAWGKIF